MDLLDEMISKLEGQLNLGPGEVPDEAPKGGKKDEREGKKKEKGNNATKAATKKDGKKKAAAAKAGPPPDDLPDICKIEFKVGVITKVWAHEGADKVRGGRGGRVVDQNSVDNAVLSLHI